jgi:putative thioredoxin
LKDGLAGPTCVFMNVTNATFEHEVLEASRAMPVVVDFWAAWCGPCRTLGPVIERVAADYAGRIKLVKVDSDANAELAAAFGIRSIPTVIAFKAGQPAAQFMGAVPEGQIRAFFDSLLPSVSEEALARAEALFEAREIDAAAQLLEELESEPRLEARIAALSRGIAYARAAAGGLGEAALQAKLAADPEDHETRLALAGLYAGQRRYREAMDALLEILRRARNWRDGEARRELIAMFELAANEPALVGEYRRKLASALH